MCTNYTSPIQDYVGSTRFGLYMYILLYILPYMHVLLLVTCIFYCLLCIPDSRSLRWTISRRLSMLGTQKSPNYKPKLTKWKMRLV